MHHGPNSYYFARLINPDKASEVLLLSCHTFSAVEAHGIRLENTPDEFETVKKDTLFCQV